MIKKGDVGDNVSVLQRTLTDNGFPVSADGWFGDETHRAVVRFQRRAGLYTDGIVGSATRKALETGSKPDDKALTEGDVKKAARSLNVQVAAIRAVTTVESRDSGFLPSGLPVVLYERHIMYRLMDSYSRGAAMVMHPNLVNESPGGYKGGEAEWRRLKRAMTIDRQAAIESTSWGLFQIMGFHWRGLGYQSADQFCKKMHISEGQQLEAFVRFIKSDRALQKALKARNWAQFARRYNGPDYQRNQYDARLAAAYDTHRRNGRIT